MRMGIVGTGGMARHHAGEYSRMRDVDITCCCDIDEEKVKEYSKKWEIPKWYVDYRRMLEQEDLDGISVVTPDPAHAPVCTAALKRGIAVLCEKPMADTLQQARKMLEEARRSNAIHMINFTKRNFSGLQGVAQLVREGGIGRITHVEASYLQGWVVTNIWGNWREDPRFLWRLSNSSGTNGTLGDIGCHIYDLATFLCGDIKEIYCRMENYDKGVENNRIGEYVLDANDSFLSTVTFGNGAIGTIHSTRWAGGFVDRQFARLCGDKGTVEFDSEAAPKAYRYFSAEKNQWETVECKPTPTNCQRFVQAIKTGVNDVSDFENGYKIQSYLHYSLLSADQRKPVTVEVD